MAELCPVCSLPKDLCVCGEISREQQRIKIRVETRKWGREMTIIEGIAAKKSELGELAAKLKASCACGGTVKNDAVMLQGDHRQRAKEILCRLGFPEENIEVQ